MEQRPGGQVDTDPETNTQSQTKWTPPYIAWTECSEEPSKEPCPHTVQRLFQSSTKKQPIEIILDQKRVSARLRAHRLDNRYPVSRRLFQTRSFPANKRLIRNDWPLLEELEQTDPLLYPPWQTERSSTIPNICPVRDEADAVFQQWTNTCSSLSMFLFTDGSRLSNSDTAGAGWYEYWSAGKQNSACGHLCLPRHEVFDAEATAALEGLRAVSDSVQAHYTQNLYILLDNKEVAQQLQACPRGSSQRTILAFQELVNAWPNQSP